MHLPPYASSPCGERGYDSGNHVKRRKRHVVVDTLGLPMTFTVTAAECAEWMRQAGFKNTRSERLVGPESTVVGIK